MLWLFLVPLLLSNLISYFLTVIIFDLFFSFLIFEFYLFILRDKGKEGERERNIDVWEIHLGCFSHSLSWGPGPQPRHVPWQGIKPATFWFAGRHSIHWATPARASLIFRIQIIPFWFFLLFSMTIPSYFLLPTFFPAPENIRVSWNSLLGILNLCILGW